MSAELINKVTNVIAFIIFIAGTAQSYFGSQEFNWLTFIYTIGGALVAWFTGKSAIALKNNK